jgi:hypothetical protein
LEWWGCSSRSFGGGDDGGVGRRCCKIGTGFALQVDEVIVTWCRGGLFVVGVDKNVGLVNDF